MKNKKTNVDMKQKRKAAETATLRQLRLALVSGVTSLLLCCAMLAGTTYAWFTEVITSGEQELRSGNMAVELRYRNSLENEWKSVFLTGGTETVQVDELFLKDKTWNAGDAEIVYLELRNAGSIPITYRLTVAEAAVAEVTALAQLAGMGTATPSIASVQDEGENAGLDWLYAGYIEGAWYDDYEQATPSNAEMIEQAEGNASAVSEQLLFESELPAAEPKGTEESEVYDPWENAEQLTLVLYMPEEASVSLLSTEEGDEAMKGQFTISLEVKQSEYNWEEETEDLEIPEAAMEYQEDDEETGNGPGMEAEGS